MKFHYISPSIFPSRSANLIHVLFQCDALASENIEVVLYGKTSIKNSHELMDEIFNKFRIRNPKLSFDFFYSRFNFLDNLKLQFMQYLKFLIMIIMIQFYPEIYMQPFFWELFLKDPYFMKLISWNMGLKK